jgi:hypothetical protein
MKTFCYGGPQHGRIYEFEKFPMDLSIVTTPEPKHFDYDFNPSTNQWDLWGKRYTYTLKKISNGQEYIRVYVGTRDYDPQKIWNMARRYKLVEQ